MEEPIPDIFRALAEYTGEDKNGFIKGNPYFIKIVPVGKNSHTPQQEVNLIDENDETHVIHYDQVIQFINDFVILQGE